MLGNLGQMRYSVPRGRMALLRACGRAQLCLWENIPSSAHAISPCIHECHCASRAEDMLGPGAERWRFSKMMRQPRSRCRKAIRLAARPSTCYLLTHRLLLVFGPPVSLFYVTTFALRRPDILGPNDVGWVP